MDKILAKIKKLLALSQSSNAHEAAAALAKAQALMAEHSIGETTLRLSDIKEVAVVSPFSVSVAKEYETRLVVVISRAFGCKPLFRTSPRGAKWIFIGRQDKIEVAAYTLTVMMRRLRQARGEYVKSLGNGRLTRVDVTKAANGFCKGWADGVTATISSFANNEDHALIEEYVAQKFKLSQFNAKKTDATWLGYDDGVKKGRAETLQRPMTTPKQEYLA